MPCRCHYLLIVRDGHTLGSLSLNIYKSVKKYWRQTFWLENVWKTPYYCLYLLDVVSSGRIDHAVPMDITEQAERR